MRWLALVCVCASLCFGLCPQESHAQSLRLQDIQPGALFPAWGMLRHMLQKSPQEAKLRKAWKEVDKWQVTLVVTTPGGILTPSWLFDARRGQVILNMTELDTLRRSFNIYARRKIRLRRRTGSPLTRAKLKLVFAAKLFPALMGARKRAALQAESIKKHKTCFPDESLEEMLLVLAHQAQHYAAMKRHPDASMLLQTIPWKKIDRVASQIKRTLSQKGRIQPVPLVRYAMKLLRRNICSFCPVFSALPTNDRIILNLTRGSRRFLLNRDRYHSLLFRRPADMLQEYRAAYRMSTAYTRAFMRHLRRKGPRYLALKDMFATNLMVDQVNQHKSSLINAIQLLKRPTMLQGIKTLFRHKLQQELQLTPKMIRSIGQTREQKWIKRETQALRELP